jgi:hypothetical protein
LIYPIAAVTVTLSGEVLVGLLAIGVTLAIAACALVWFAVRQSWNMSQVHTRVDWTYAAVLEMQRAGGLFERFNKAECRLGFLDQAEIDHKRDDAERDRRIANLEAWRLQSGTDALVNVPPSPSLPTSAAGETTRAKDKARSSKPKNAESDVIVAA